MYNKDVETQIDFRYIYKDYVHFMVSEKQPDSRTYGETVIVEWYFGKKELEDVYNKSILPLLK